MKIASLPAQYFKLSGVSSRLLAAAHDTLMSGVSFVLALYLRLGGDQFYKALPYLVPGTVLFMVICTGVFSAMRLYRGIWRFASLPDVIAITKAVTIAVGVFALAMFMLTRLEGLPRSVPFINWLLLIALLTGPRVAHRVIKDRRTRPTITQEGYRIPLLLVGATHAADLFIRDCARDPHALYRVVALADDNPSRQGRALHGLPIYGDLNDLSVLIQKLERAGSKPQRIILADDGLPPHKVKALLEQAEALGLPLGRLPRLGEFKDGAPASSEIRAIAIEDLLGRPQVTENRAQLETLVKGKRIAITGAGGSIGSELVRQLAGLEPAALLLIDACEHFLYLIDQELGQSHGHIPRQASLMDVRSVEAIRALFAQWRPQLVFHAAAVKHVPLSEANPLAAIETNVLGSRIIGQAAQAADAEAMVMISTDKAVNPSNVMGATKRLAETWCQANGQTAEGKTAEGQTRFLTVRFGNVLGSHGSVVPLFTRQIHAGGPITVTHPDMVRYFMTIREAVELVLQAAALGAKLPRREAIFVLDMGKPIKIVDLARQMIRLAGLKPDDISIQFTGLRPGEKLFEELFYDAERVARTEFPGVLIAASRECALEKLEKSLNLLQKHCQEQNKEAALALLSALVPEFHCGATFTPSPEVTNDARPRAALRIG